ncbi:proteasome subunit beta type 3 [Dictyostelium discoideum AX4]|uniref:Proteasome subunit beta type-3 n=1 Tax=Dictyostelium discoideum TaxID=44689 RepID=PSB3_DICDI|nr:proteasome subunit beta type 3 [Dictyostelium discoideum AX4]Q55D66.1 RecName: Full=Proteasome subunit beta type-3 [Dictyostelium discoideum]EAL72236.1 proteasome subunit beta type 3 [Dictyostelium discoideum AX4]|eukprot:XP_646265.1 proteasome subunit beta type 3 [Dictyostelium discoideum AX4]
MSIMAYNGGACIVMVGKNCVAIASDLRFGIQQQTISNDFPKVYRINDKCFVGISGLVTDAQTLYQKLVFRHNLYKLREERDMSPRVVSNLLTNMLYEKRFGPYFTEPLICGLEGPDNTPFISGMDLIGASVATDDFLVVGTMTPAMYGVCETLYKKDMNEDDLFETISQCMLASLDRDALSGWGAIVHVITPTQVITKKLLGRQD